MRKVLFVDDSKAVQAFLKESFSTLDYDCHHAYNGKEAVEILKSDTSFDLIVLDWEMPVMTGPETLVAVRDMQIDIPIIMLTTRNAPEDIESALTKGANEYCMKPFTADILIDKIESVVEANIKVA